MKNDIDLFKLFTRDLKPYPPLSHAEAARLLRLARDGSLESRDKLILSMAGLGLWTATKFRGLDQSNVVSAANFAVIQTVDRAIADPNWVTNVTGIGARAVYWAALALTRERRSVVFGSRDSRVKHPQPVDVTIEDSEEEDDMTEKRQTLTDILAEPGMNPEEEAIHAEAQARVAASLATLTPREQLVIGAMYGLDGGDSLKAKDIATELGVTVSTVKHTSQRALRKLRKIEGLREALQGRTQRNLARIVARNNTGAE